MSKLHHKVRNDQNLPHASLNFRNYFFKVILRTITILPQQFFQQKNSFFSTLHTKMYINMCIWRHKLYNAKTGVGPTFTWSNEA